MMCSHASTCGERIRCGDRPNGCNKQDQRQCATAANLSRTAGRLHIERVPTKEWHRPGILGNTDK